MPTEITMPKLSDTMTEGRLISWKKNVGEKVERGEIIAEVETDKATMELEAFSSGVLLEVRIKPGETAPVGTVIALVGKEGEKPAGGEKPEKEPEKVKEEEEKPEKEPEKEKEEKPEKEPEKEKEEEKKPEKEPDKDKEEEKKPEKEEKEKAAAKGQASSAETEDLPEEGEKGEAPAKASPLVRRLAREKGIDLSRVEGSGPEGRVLQEDLEKAGTRTHTTGLKDSDPHYGPKGLGTGKDKTSTGAGTARPLSRMRAAIARTVSEAWRTIPHFSVTVEMDMGEAERVRQELKGSGTPVSLNDFIVKAAALALGKFPNINASFAGDGITVHSDINIGIAVALDDGLLVPVVKGCQGLSLKEIAAGSRDLIARAKAGKIRGAEISGGTFSISNLGMFGVDEFTAVILPPQGAILAVGAVADRPVIKGGHLVAGRMMRATLSADHRLIDGAYAARFLREVKRILENPVTLLV